MATHRRFIDTDVLIYALALDQPVKQHQAIQLLRESYEQSTGVLSTQVLQEFCNVALKKLKLSPMMVRSQLDFYEQFEVVQVTPSIIRDAIDIHQTRQTAFYDSIILASAIIAGCSTLYSEDFNAGQVIHGLKIQDPFAQRT